MADMVLQIYHADTDGDFNLSEGEIFLLSLKF